MAIVAVGGATAAFAALGVFACSPLVQLNEWLVPEDGYVRHRGIAYGEGPRRKLDVYVPENSRTVGPGLATASPGDASSGAAPVVVFFYGGAWNSGSRDYYPFVGEALASRGYVVVIPDYRVYPEVRFPEFVEDGAAALRWVEDNIADYGGRAEQVVIMGHSAGAHIAAMLIADDHYLTDAGVDRHNIRGFVGLAGPYAFDPMEFRATRPIFAGATAPLMPAGLINGDEPPMLLLYGSDDSTVSPENSRALAGRVWAMGGEARLVEYPEKGHIDIVLAMAGAFRDEDGPHADVLRFLATIDAASAPPLRRRPAM